MSLLDEYKLDDVVITTKTLNKYGDVTSTSQVTVKGFMADSRMLKRVAIDDTSLGDTVIAMDDRVLDVGTEVTLNGVAYEVHKVLRKRTFDETILYAGVK